MIRTYFRKTGYACDLKKTDFSKFRAICNPMKQPVVFKFPDHENAKNISSIAKGP